MKGDENLKKLSILLLTLAVTSILITGVYAKSCQPQSNGKVTGGGQIPITDGKASFGFNAMKFSKDEKPKGELQYIDHVTGMKVHAHEIETVWVWDELLGNKPHPMAQARFTGPCTVNHVSGYTFVVWTLDNGEPGKTDQFYITINGPDGFYYTNPLVDDVTLLHGNIQIHKPPK